MEAIHDSHQCRLIQIAIYAGGCPRLVAVSVKAYGDPDVGGSVMRGYVDSRNAEPAQAHLRDRRVPLFQLLPHSFGERVDRAGTLSACCRDCGFTDG